MHVLEGQVCATKSFYVDLHIHLIGIDPALLNSRPASTHLRVMLLLMLCGAMDLAWLLEQPGKLINGIGTLDSAGCFDGSPRLSTRVRTCIGG